MQVKFCRGCLDVENLTTGDSPPSEEMRRNFDVENPSVVIHNFSLAPSYSLLCLEFV